ncbi:MAG: hypothetical protein ACSHX8_10120 [Opitutaceae bacterium]
MIVATSACAQLTPGFDQRYKATDYTIGSTTWTDSVGTADATTTNAKGFSATTTPNGTAAVANMTSGAVDGDIFTFTRTSELGSRGQLTVQSVIRIDANLDDRSGPYALDQTKGWSGLFAGANANGSHSFRGGNVGNTNANDGGVLGGSGDAVVPAGTWGIFTVIVDASVASPQMTVSFADLATGNTLFSNTAESSEVGLRTLGLSNKGVLFGGEQGHGAADTNGWGGAIADVIVYNTALSNRELAGNQYYFTSTYRSIPEARACALLAGLVCFGALIIRRRYAP